MKTLQQLIIAFVLTIISFQVKAQDQLVSFENLPKEAQKFVTTYYGAEKVSYVKLDKGFFSNKYEVKLLNGVEIEFDNKGNWTEVDAKKGAVPNQIVSSSILNHINKSFPNNKIVQISREGRNIEVELTNGLELVFSKNGKFIGIED